MEPRRILFVCLGNIVRSPLAENLFKHLAARSGVQDQYEIDSAGTGRWHVGESPDARMQQVAMKHGLQYTGRARQFERRDFDHFDLIVAMDLENRQDLYSMARTPADRAKIHLLREFDPHGGTHAEVPDPYYDRIDGFERVYQIIERSCQGLLEALQEGKL